MEVPVKLAADQTLHDLVPQELRRSWAAQGIYRDQDIYSLFRAHAIANPGRTAILDADGAISYADLDVLVRRLAVGLTGLGVGEHDVVAVQLPNERLACAFDLAIAAVGAIALPYPVGRGDREAWSLLSRSRAVAVVTPTSHGDYPCAERTRAMLGDLPHLRTVIEVGGETAGCVPVSALLRGDPARFEQATPDPDGPARILVTSGSEAEPKMVLYSHNALVGGRGRFMAALLGDTPSPRVYVMVPLASSYGSNGTAVTLATHGATLVLRPRFDVDTALAAIVRDRPTHVLAVPTMFRMITDSGAQRDTSSLRVVALGGAALDAVTAGRVRESLGCAVVNVYGSADGVNCHTAVDGVPDSAGRPNPEVAHISIVDDDLRPVAAGEVGEIVSLGPMSPMCYVGAPELNARYRLPDGSVCTGDLGHFDADGHLHVVGRRKDIIIRGGLNISPAEVEGLLATHPAIRDVVCVPVSDPVLGERLCACVVAERDLSLAEVTAHLAAQGLEPRKFPERVVVLGELPLGPAGKVDRRAVQELIASRAR
ncbi:non-ribosomal peptide synthetase component E (peptide arylation enzyme) [Actinokineospora baliensis]|uniref:class I adenylate-forming enzyme family protein n=1 Tax=Actinokineospora baliensis TaxID=547056 RepID=UPI0027DD45CA|nr:class I adenylate-forming enzyme family protein [Actinokineospora baliensis]MBM7775538.1 non-ribosomal peptide synthetase component E (peptide arylation enzyme) [Actinokineospora baliensis]